MKIKESAEKRTKSCAKYKGLAKVITNHSLTGQNIIIFHDGLFNIINRKNWRITIKLRFENLSIKHTHMLGPFPPPLPPLPFQMYVLFE